jgi:hypothetical protein
MELTEQDWPLAERISSALDLFERTAKGGFDPIFRPSPFHIAAALSAAREALQILVERQAG